MQKMYETHSPLLQLFYANYMAYITVKSISIVFHIDIVANLFIYYVHLFGISLPFNRFIQSMSQN